MDDATAVVTGASRGIGAAVARLFADEGAHVVICARDEAGVEDVAEDVRAAGGSVTARAADVREASAVADLVAAAPAPIDVVVPCAGVYRGDPGETPLAETDGGLSTRTSRLTRAGCS